ncbi:MAG: aminopeptidase N, partial [Actinobacteria bacterium]|nr:aminopeptidase N [Actinomycetota bacterium]
MSSLSRETARERAREITVTGYDVALDLTGDSARHFRSVTTIRFESATGATTFVDVAPHEIGTARLNGEPLDPAGLDRATRRLPLRPGAGSNELVVDAVMTYSHDGEGLHRHVDPADGRTYLYAMSFLDAAPRWFACFDQPDLKAPVRLTVDCPPDWVVAGNGPARPLGPGRWEIVSAGPLATYFTTLVAGPYHALREVHDGIPLTLLARQSLAQHLDRDREELFAHTRQALDGLHELFGVRYPWGEYVQAFVPEFNAGAMENPGCVTLRDPLVFRSQVTDAERRDRAMVITHEAAHMWFGDLVTMRWWDDLWLNESFAEYLGYRVVGDRGWVSFGARRKSWGYAADRRPSTHPVAGNGAADAASALTEFDGISYAKGASVLRQLAAHLGDDLFLAGLRAYIVGHAGGNAELADLLAAWRAAGARDPGYDTLHADGDQLRRETPNGAGRPHAIAVTAYGADGTALATRPVAVTADRTALDLPAAPLVLPDSGDE